jgi:hypothetical protein
MRTVSNWLSRAVDGGSLAALRFAVGLCLLLECVTLLAPRDGTNFLAEFYTGPKVHWLFPYPGLEWVRPLAAGEMQWLVLGMGLAGLCLAAGFLSRLAAAVGCLLWTYVFLLDATHYNNHYYLLAILLFWSIWMPSDRQWSVRAGIRALRGKPRLSPWVPFWCVFLLQAQLVIVYFYGGISKLSPEWLWDAEPIYSWLQEPRTVQAFADFASELGLPENHWFQSKGWALLLSYGGLLFDLSIGWLLWMRRTRLLGTVLALGFHAINHFFLFENIGWFPLLGVLTLPIFWEPDWPQRFMAWLRRPRWRAPDWKWFWGGLVVIPGIGALLGWQAKPSTAREGQPARIPLRFWTPAVVMLWIAVQVLLPWRHALIEGPVNWTAEGERFSWRMKTGQKHVGPIRFRVEDAAILPAAKEGDAASIDDVRWEAWPLARVVLTDVDADRVDWRALPELVTVLQPFVGEQVFYNPFGYGADQPLDEAAAQNRAKFLWKQAFGREPRLRGTVPIRALIESAQSRWEKESVAWQALNEIGWLAVMLSREGWQKEPDSPDDAITELSTTPDEARGHRSALVGQLHQRLVDLLSVPGGQELVRQIARGAPPLALYGAPAVRGGTFIAIDDPEIMTTGSGGLATVERAKWQAHWAGADQILADVGRMTSWEWYALPAMMVIKKESGAAELLWNSDADLTEIQSRVMRGRPPMVQQYVQRIAGYWERVFGRRPAVYVTNPVALVPHPLQLAIDPQVDLVEAPLAGWGHNVWIMPLQP